MGGLNFRFWNITLLLRATAKDFYGHHLLDISGTVLWAPPIAEFEAEFVWTLLATPSELIHVIFGLRLHPQVSLAQTLDTVPSTPRLVRQRKPKIPLHECAQAVE